MEVRVLAMTRIRPSSNRAAHMALLIFVYTLLARPATADYWQHLSSFSGNDPCVDAKGRIWTSALESCMHVFPDGGVTSRDLVTDPGWRDIPMPGTYGAHSYVVTPDDTLYVACIEKAGGPGTVFRCGVAPGSSWEELPVPGAYGLLMSMAVDSSGTVWLGGERGEVYRLEGRRWCREVLPVPLHCDPMICAPSGRIWARAQTRAEARIMLRDNGVWRVLLATNASPTADLLYADDETAVMNIGTLLHRVHASRPAVMDPWVDLGANVIAVESPNSAWGLRGRILVHAVGQQVTVVGEVPFMPLDCWWQSGCLWVAAESGLWRLVRSRDDGPDRITWPLGLDPGGVPDYRIGSHPTYGVGVIELEGRENLYLARYTTTDLIIPLGTEERMRTWAAKTASVGISEKAGDTRRFSVYEMGMVAADLNADGSEDVVLSTMYAGCHLLRNMHDVRLLPWTTKSGLGPARVETTEDVDLLDADGDGDLDLYVSVLQGADQIWMNDGGAHFVEVASITGILTPFASTSALCRDLDGDHDTDIVVSSCGGGLYVSENLGAADGLPRFRTSILMAPLASPDAPNGLSTDNLTGAEAMDVDDDGLFDLVVGSRSQPTHFLRNRGGMRFEADDSIFDAGPPNHKILGAVALDPDADGDWDLALTGRQGTRFLEYRSGCWVPPGNRPQQLLFSQAICSTGSVVVDADEDGDLDYIEGLDGAAPMLYRNTNARRPLIVHVRGPMENCSAVGARVEILHAGTNRRAAAPQEVPGGSGYVSHATKRLAFGGLSPDSLYDVSVRLPSGRQARTNGVRGAGECLISMQTGLAGFVEATTTRWRSGLRDRWTAIFWSLTALSILGVGAYGALQERRLATAYPWIGVLSIPVIAWGIRRLLHLDPGGMPVFVAVLGGLASGLLAVGFARPRPRPATMTMLADFGRSLRVFEHNQTPRRIVDRIMLMRANAPERPEDWSAIVPLLREDVALFGVVVAPELAFVVEGARSVGIESSEGARLLRQLRTMHQRLLAVADDAWTTPRQVAHLDALLETTKSFREWTGRLRVEVDAMLSTSLRPFMHEYANSRMALHDATVEVDVPNVVVRLPATEMSRVLDILLENAVHACAGRKVSLKIGGRQGVGRVTIAVWDDGPGVPADLRPRVFEAGVTGVPGGSGFGLYAARRTIEHFGGMIMLVDAPSGTCFEMELGTIRDPEA